MYVNGEGGCGLERETLSYEDRPLNGERLLLYTTLIIQVSTLQYRKYYDAACIGQ